MATCAAASGVARGNRFDDFAVLGDALAQARQRDRQLCACRVDDAGVAIHRLDRRNVEFALEDDGVEIPIGGF